jgi:hypothetical protein
MGVVMPENFQPLKINKFSIFGMQFAQFELETYP